MKSSFGDHVRVAIDGRVAVVTLDHPPHNFVSAPILEELADAIDAADVEREVRAVVLQAEGKSFCAGADLSESGAAGVADASGMHPFYVHAERLYAADKPIVAAVHGAAVGAGLGLALAADFRIVSPEARFVANFVKLGFHPGFAISLALPRIVGEQKAALMLLTGRRIKADVALAWGLADEIVPAEELRAAALRLAREIAENAPLAVVATRKTLRADLAAAARARIAVEYEQQRILRSTEDFAEGVRAVNERRPGSFAGR